MESFLTGQVIYILFAELSFLVFGTVLLDHGRVAETGDHASLTAARGIYCTLVRNQLKLG